MGSSLMNISHSPYFFALPIRLLPETKHDCFRLCRKTTRFNAVFRPRTRFGLWMEAKQPLDSETLAYRSGGRAEEATTHAWRRHLDSPEGLESSEDSLRRGNTGTIIAIWSI